MIDTNATRLTLASNLNRLMEVHLSLNSNPKMAKRTGLGLGTIARARNADVAVTVDTLEVLAECFDLQPWQLLVHGLDPLNPPVLRSMSVAESDLFDRLRKVIVSQYGDFNADPT
jgi:hypothetical protein